MTSQEHGASAFATLDAFPFAWRSRQPLYDFIIAHSHPEVQGLLEGADQLPDRAHEEIRFVPGFAEGVGLMHGPRPGGSRKAGSDDEEPEPGELTPSPVLYADQAFALLTVLRTHQGESTIGALYSFASEHRAIEYIDGLLRLIRSEWRLLPAELREIARWLAMRSPDREPVKLAMALLGTQRGLPDSDLLLTLGRHEEFTLFTAVAVQNSMPLPDRTLWELAKQVHGWGRIQTVRRLLETKDTEVKAWLLREGFRNRIMNVYSAYDCAVAGNLRGELDQPQLDETTLTAAAGIIEALLEGGPPVKAIRDWPDGPGLVGRFLHHVVTSEPNLQALPAVARVVQFLGWELERWDELAKLGWSVEVRQYIGEQARSILAMQQWRPLVDAGLKSGDSQGFVVARSAAIALRIDAWEPCFHRLEQGDESQWYYVWRTQDRERLERALALAETTLPLEDWGSGPALSRGLGPRNKAQQYLRTLLDRLRDYPGLGWPVIRVALRSPVTRERWSALAALAKWDTAQWPEDAAQLLNDLITSEPDDKLREQASLVRDGKPMTHDPTAPKPRPTRPRLDL